MSDRARATGIVLAGGRSTRFGSPKLAVELDGEPLLHLALRPVGAVAGEIIVVGGDGPIQPVDIVEGTSIRWVPDVEPFAGPLAALADALAVTVTAVAIVVGGDMPCLVPSVLDLMLGRLTSNGDLDAVVLAGPAPPGDRRQILPLAVRVGAASTAAAEAVRNGDRALVRVLGRLRFVEIPAPEWLTFDPGGQTLLDVDRPDDLERIRQKFR